MQTGVRGEGGGGGHLMYPSKHFEKL